MVGICEDLIDQNTMWVDVTHNVVWHISTLWPICVPASVGRCPTKRCGHYPVGKLSDD